MRAFKRLMSGTTAAVLTLSSLMSMGFTGVAHAASGSDTCTWTGATDLKFSTATNWSGCSGAAPVSGDTVAFVYIANYNNNQTAAINNDLPNVAFAGLTLGVSGASGPSATFYDINNMKFANNAVITKAGGGGYVNFTNSVTAAGSLTIDGRAYVGADSKDITLNVTNLTVTNNPSSCAGGGGGDHQFSIVPTGTLTVGPNTAWSLNGTESSVIVASGGLLYLPYSTSPVTYGGDITFQGGGSTQGSSCGDPVSLYTSSDVTLTGKITLAGGDITYQVADGKTLTVSGQIDGAGNALKAFQSSTGTFVNNASSDNSATSKGSQTVSTVELPAVTDSQPDAYFNADSNTIIALDGARGGVYVAPKATLKGTGSAKTLYVSKGGTIAPGHSPGTFTVVKTLNLNDGSTYQAELKDTAAGDYDQIAVGDSSQTDTTDPNGVVVLGDLDYSAGGATPTVKGNPILDASLYNGYKIAKGDKFTIIDNKSQTAVKGTFANLPEGATFKVGTAVFSITYKGGDGNDVVLTNETAPTTPDTGFATIAAHPAATLAVSVIAAGAIFFMAQQMKPARATARSRSSRSTSRRRR